MGDALKSSGFSPVLALAALGLLLAGCGSQPDPFMSPESRTTAQPTVHRLDHHDPTPEGYQILASVDDRDSPGPVGVFPVTKKDAFVFLSCYGKGGIVINIDPVGEFPLPCSTDPTAGASKNQFQVSDYDQFRVTIDSRPGQRWAATIAVDPKGP
jgi:hypothetical protein